MSRDDIVRAAKARARAARAALARARALTAGTRAASANTYDMTVIKLREAERRRCPLCSGDIDIGPCSCTMRCSAEACRPSQAGGGAWWEEASIP